MSGREHTRNLARLRLVTPGPPDDAARTPRPDDGQLLAAVRSGDQAAGAAFYDRVKPQIDRTLLRLFGRHENDCDDLRQLALIELVFTLHRFRGECSLDTWVGTVTAHIVFKHLRRRQTEARLFGVLHREDALPPSGMGTARHALVRNLMQRASRHIDAIHPDKALAFVMHDLFGYDLKELAEIMRVSVSAAQTRLVRGRRELHDRIARDPELANLLDKSEGWP
jgi:RNA polymerase sigma-70 factor (ECF subfamily)